VDLIAFSPEQAAITSALIAGAVSYLASVFSKELKTSEFRQAWIDGLRNDIAEFVASVISIRSQLHARLALSPVADVQMAMLESPEFKFSELYKARLKLRLNPAEHSELMRLLDEFDAPGTLVSKDKVAFNAKVQLLTTEFQAVLKNEWKRVKRGEPTFRVTKWVSLIVAVTAVAGLAIQLSTHREQRNERQEPLLKQNAPPARESQESSGAAATSR
jgi:hypothetical protein